jgi:hypothetical protein
VVPVLSEPSIVPICIAHVKQWLAAVVVYFASKIFPNAALRPVSWGMAKDPDKADVSESASRIVRETTGDLEKSLPPDLEAAWAEWSKGIQKVDTRGMTLLRAAFEAGWESGQKTLENKG